MNLSVHWGQYYNFNWNNVIFAIFLLNYFYNIDPGKKEETRQMGAKMVEKCYFALKWIGFESL